jgi:alpha-ketoglutarate-dependent taurine dioxygenase
MITTDAFFKELSDFDLASSRLLCRKECVAFDPDRFLELVYSSIFEAVPSTDGNVSIVKQGSDVNDLSASSADLDFHADGNYHHELPQIVGLYCVNPGLGRGETILSDGCAAFASITDERMRRVLCDTTIVYTSRHGTEHKRPLIVRHPRTGELTPVVGSRIYQRQSFESRAIEHLPTFREMTEASYELFRRLDEHQAARIRWKPSEICFFDNYRYPHRRVGAGNDPDRHLLRIWITLSKNYFGQLALRDCVAANRQVPGYYSRALGRIVPFSHLRSTAPAP